MHVLHARLSDRRGPHSQRTRREARRPVHRLRRMHPRMSAGCNRAADRPDGRPLQIRMQGGDSLPRPLRPVRFGSFSRHDLFRPETVRLRRCRKRLARLRRSHHRHGDFPERISRAISADLLLLPDRSAAVAGEIPGTGRSAAARAGPQRNFRARRKAPHIQRNRTAAGKNRRSVHHSLPRQNRRDPGAPRHAAISSRRRRLDLRPVPDPGSRRFESPGNRIQNRLGRIRLGSGLGLSGQIPAIAAGRKHAVCSRTAERDAHTG